MYLRGVALLKIFAEIVASVDLDGVLFLSAVDHALL